MPYNIYIKPLCLIVFLISSPTKRIFYFSRNTYLPTSHTVQNATYPTNYAGENKLKENLKHRHIYIIKTPATMANNAKLNKPPAL